MRWSCTKAVLSTAALQGGAPSGMSILNGEILLYLRSKMKFPWVWLAQAPNSHLGVIRLTQRQIPLYSNYIVSRYCDGLNVGSLRWLAHGQKI